MKTKRRCLSKIFYVSMGVAGLSLSTADAFAEEKAKAEVAMTEGKAENPDGLPDAKALPMTRNVVSRGAIDAQNAQDGSEAVQSVAGVTSANSKGAENSSLNVRGIQLNLFTSYRLNGGLPIAGVITTPAEDKERIEALKGANALMFGIASPGGILNLVTKRAKDKDITRLILAGSSFGQYGAAIDVGRKFGDEKQFGLRANLSDTHVESGVVGAHGYSVFGSVAADWRVTKQLSFMLDVEKYHRDVIEQAGITPLKAVNGVIPVPRIPDPTKILSGPWAQSTPTTENIQFRSDYVISDDWKALAEVGVSDSTRSKFNTRINNYNLATGQGKEIVTFLFGQHYLNKFGRAELLGNFDTGPIKHDLTLGVSSSERYYSNPSTSNFSTPQNIYNPVAIAAPPLPTAPPTFLPQDSKDKGIYTYDTLNIGRDWKALAGIRRTSYRADNTKPGGGHSVTDSQISSPAFGLLYDVVPNTTLYASYMKGLEETGQAPIGTVNQLVILPPASATQKEVGIRSTYFQGISASLAYFNIVRANAVTDAKSDVFLIDGTNKFQGWESTVTADINPWWMLSFAGQLLDAKQNPLIDPTLRGLTPENTAKLSGNFSVSHRSQLVPGLTLRAGMSYVGRRYVNSLDQASIPGVVLYTLGAGYATTIGGHRTVLQLSVDNLTNKRYWNSATTSAYGTGMERSLRANAKIDF